MGESTTNVDQTLKPAMPNSARQRPASTMGPRRVAEAQAGPAGEPAGACGGDDGQPAVDPRSSMARTANPAGTTEDPRRRVVAHRGARVRVGSGFQHIPQGDAHVQLGGMNAWRRVCGPTGLVIPPAGRGAGRSARRRGGPAADHRSGRWGLRCARRWPGRSPGRYARTWPVPNTGAHAWKTCCCRRRSPAERPVGRCSGAAPDSGSEMGAEAFRQVRSDTVSEADRGSVTCADARELTFVRQRALFGTKRPPKACCRTSC